ncbi:MAG TPA: hypothetical protein PLJ12_14075, partial [Planctomycetota bacterium]|nr:hypothetical protein [Planctomycetota bacterium]
MTSPDLPEGILRDLLASPDRAATPGQPPICSLNGEEDPHELAAWSPWIRERLQLSRRGVDHGEWLILTEDAVPLGPQPPIEALW